MAKRRNRGGGFLRGALYGLIVSVVIFLGLTVAFPLIEPAPMASVANPVQTAPQAFDVGPGNPDDSGVTMGANTDSTPNVGESANLSVGDAVDQPVVATESAAVPDIGDGSGSVEVTPEETETTPPVAVIAQPDEVAPVEAAPALPDAASGEAFDVFSVPFTRDPDIPMMAIIFEDTLEASLQQLFNADIPLTFAVSGTVQDPQVSRNYRETGFEVLTLLPENVPIDTDLNLVVSEYILNVPASIGLIDNSSNGIMFEGGATQILIQTAAVNGMGTIAFAGAGDINARNLSRFFGNPFGSVNRVIDGVGENAAIKSALDSATLTAQTNGSVIVYARTRDVTIQALIEWMASPFAERVQIVPVSQIMRP
ncbi:MAG: divergent polysaccharide deacetylase family protein [Rhodobacteraceae bacterium]|nr:divergent polysaccharide deacetylase family protein [Paracoccaceae bacterium]